MAYETLKTAINEVIRTNGVGDIGGDAHFLEIERLIDHVGKYATFVGIATPTTTPTALMDEPAFYLASEIGTYTNLSGVVVSGVGIYAISNSTGAWVISML